MLANLKAPRDMVITLPLNAQSFGGDEDKSEDEPNEPNEPAAGALTF
jgi:hypothetical protein